MIVDTAEGLIDLDGRPYYVVPDVDRMPPFLTSVISDGDRWMFASSTGSLTAGRFDADRSLFPYQTDDKVHAAAGEIGPVTRLRVAGDRDAWRPFLDTPRSGGRRALGKAVFGDALVLEESDPGRGLVVSTRWESSWQHGFVRTTTVSNIGERPLSVDVLDGLIGVLPHGIDPLIHQRLSNLSNAYKRSEMVDDRLAVFALESPVSDSAEPAEVLRATVVWSTGLDDAEITLDAAALTAFDDGEPVSAVPLVTGRPGAYLLSTTVDLDVGASVSWRVIADVDLDQFGVLALADRIATSADIDADIGTALDAGHDRVEEIMALADAEQLTGDPAATAHHVANTTYNVLRGGVPLTGYDLDRADLVEFIGQRNAAVAQTHAEWLGDLPERLSRSELLAAVGELDDPHLHRLANEYLPFSFSRRHGDPSRPWNRFSIQVHDDAGRPVIRYEGNWRDVFQNWEALCLSFPDYLAGTITTFVNASTPDGYNPYRISREGIDWEVPDPDDPWANIGYWGDHQLIYLLRLLEIAEQHRPGEVAAMLGTRSCVYADVPYRISSFDELRRDPKTTITFDDEAHDRLVERAATLGGDGRLLHTEAGEIVTVTLLEKLLVSVLAKLANFVPGGGIWMNTQRPEWNDANNALVGYGLSVVTLCHLRRFLVHLKALVNQPAGGTASGAAVATEVARWLELTTAGLVDSPVAPEGAVDRHRAEVLARLAGPASEHRRLLYESSLSGDTTLVTAAQVTAMCDAALAHVDDSIRANRRPDGLMHSYNLISFADDGATATVSHLPEMLEGQVAGLTSGALTATEQADLVDALFVSPLHRADVDTFTLAAPQLPPSFLAKNIVADPVAAADPLVSALLDADERSVVARDAAGQIRFHPDLVDAAALDDRLDQLAAQPAWAEAVAHHRDAVHDTYERTFGHQAFLGRSAAMYGYEGIGSVYWHMVSKLLLATQEAARDAADSGADEATVARLVDGYRRVRDGLGLNRTAREYGAVPTEPYSHTPAHAGAQQPGMTGAVKEELLARRAELGIRVDGGELIVDPLLLRAEERLADEHTWTVRRPDGSTEDVVIPPSSFGLTVAQTPIVVTVGTGAPAIEVDFVDGRTERIEGTRLGTEISKMVFARTGEIRCIRVNVELPGLRTVAG